MAYAVPPSGQEDTASLVSLILHRSGSTQSYRARDPAAKPVEHWGAQIPLALLIRKVSSNSISLEKACSNPFCGEV